MTRIAAATAATLARAPAAPSDFEAAGDALHGAFVRWAAPAGNGVDHFIVAARSTGENFYRTRISVPASTTSRNVLPQELGFVGGENFFISVSAVDAAGHESLFAYPEFRCDAVSCVVPPGAANIIAPE